MNMRTKLKQFRVGLHMTQGEFADSLGYTRSHYGRIENGEKAFTMRLWDTIRKIYGLSDDKIRELTECD